jgi:hypothetical protein
MKNTFLVRASLTALVGLLASGCGKATTGFSISQTEPPAAPCTAGSTAKKLRIFVMVDNSGSTSASDPDQNYRVQTLRTFLRDYGSHSNLRYGFGYFSSDAYLYDVNQSRFVRGNASVSFGTSSNLVAALDTYHSSVPPTGTTGYGAAFSAIESAIARDESGGATEDYAVVFMSDGRPTDLNGSITTALNSLIDRLKATAQSNGKSKITISTVYFGGTSDTTAIRNLSSMATRGGGQFVDTNRLESGGLSINDVITIPDCAI